jgi:acetolactate synthase-1/2/3 large subunit
VVLDIPKDVQNGSGEFKGSGSLPMPGYRKRLETLTTDIIDGTEANHFFEMLGESQRPLIYAGGGAINANASAELRAFAQEFDIPVVTTLMGIGAVDTTSALSMRMLGMHGAAFANYAVDDCDFLIAIGARFDDRVAGMPSRFAPGAKYIAHFDIDRAEINKVKRVQWSHVGELPEALTMLASHGKRMGFTRDRSAWLAHLAENPYFASDPTPALKEAAPLIWQGWNLVTYQDQPVWSNTVVTKLVAGKSLTSLLPSLGDGLAHAAQAAGYEVERE